MAQRNSSSHGLVKVKCRNAFFDQQGAGVKISALERAHISMPQPKDGILKPASPHPADVFVFFQSACRFAIGANYFVHANIGHALGMVPHADDGILVLPLHINDDLTAY